MRVDRLRWFAAAAVLAVVISGCGRPGDRFQAQRVVHVYDGDTVKLANGQKVRLIGIDTPEAYESDKLHRDVRRTGRTAQSIMADGKRATAFTSGLALNRDVMLESDRELYDQYGRRLAYVYIPLCRWHDGEPPCRVEENDEQYLVTLDIDEENHGIFNFLNATIVKAGFARPYPFAPNTRYADLFDELYAQAGSRRAGFPAVPQ